MLSRLTFGARPGELDAVTRSGVDVWLERQLSPERIEEPRVERLLQPLAGALAAPAELVSALDADTPRELRQALTRSQQLERVQTAALVRHVWSERQLYEVMVDFWTNHFNVFARKGMVRLFVGDYLERAIRPHALGKFEDLLQATARHPAMLLYLDNARSIANASEDAPPRRRRRGLNENYARELLELHTLGVDGGYTQRDVVEVARILTGYSVKRPREGRPGFVFRSRVHDRGEKLVLGRRFPAGGGEAEVRELLRFLARHESTARHLARRLCLRFVSDEPSPRCQNQLAEAYRVSQGDIRAVLKALVRLPELYTAPRTKLKSPLELLASSLRALDAEPVDPQALPRRLAALGQPLLLEPVPTGYSIESADWTSSGAVAARLAFAAELGSGRFDAVRFAPLSLATEPQRLREEAAQRLLAGRLSPASAERIDAELTEIPDAEERRRAALVLTLGSPDFQHH